MFPIYAEVYRTLTDDLDDPPIVWRRSSRSANGNCVEAARYGDGVLLRDSKHPAGPVLHLTPAAWAALLAAVRAGQAGAE